MMQVYTVLKIVALDTECKFHKNRATLVGELVLISKEYTKEVHTARDTVIVSCDAQFSEKTHKKATMLRGFPTGAVVTMYKLRGKTVSDAEYNRFIVQLNKQGTIS